MLLLTGKGGVGKTSVAAATAVRAAAAGARVLVTSTDPAHSLADALDVPLGDAPQTVDLRPALAVTPVPGDGGNGGPSSDRMPGSTPGTLQALQLDATRRLERHWGEIRGYLAELLRWGGVGDVAAEELLLLPGLGELFALLDLREQVGGGAYDLVVVDCAPTAETLGLLALPEALRWYGERVLGAGRRLAQVVVPLTRALGAQGAPLPEPRVLATTERLHAALREVHAVLGDPEVTSLRLVANAERVVVAETLRLLTSASVLGYPVDAVVANRLLPASVVDPQLVRWQVRQREHLATLVDSVAPVPVLTASLAADEVVGVARLAELAHDVYGHRDATAVLHRGLPLALELTTDGAVLRVAAPGVRTGDVVLHRRGGELLVEVAGVRRHLALPAAVQRLEVLGARIADGHLEVRFGGGPGAQVGDQAGAPAGGGAAAVS